MPAPAASAGFQQCQRIEGVAGIEQGVDARQDRGWRGRAGDLGKDLGDAWVAGVDGLGLGEGGAGGGLGEGEAEAEARFGAGLAGRDGAAIQHDGARRLTAEPRGNRSGGDGVGRRVAQGGEARQRLPILPGP